MHIFISLENSVLDPDLEMGGGGQSPEKIFQFALRMGGSPLGPFPGPGSATKPSCLMGNDLRLTQFHSRGDNKIFNGKI